jgi:hypothetical protein
LAWETEQAAAWAAYIVETKRAVAECTASLRNAKTPEESEAAFAVYREALDVANARQLRASIGAPEKDPSRRAF